MTTGNYLGGYPGNTFAFPRSYVTQLSVLGDSADVEFSGDLVTMFISRPLNYGVAYILQPYIQPWSSNRYTLDFVVQDCWWFFGLDGVHHVQDFTVNVWWRGTPARPTLTLVQPLAGTQEAFLDLPPAPPDYWLPQFP